MDKTNLRFDWIGETEIVKHWDDLTKDELLQYIDYLEKKVKNCSIPNNISSDLLPIAKQMKLEQQLKIDSYTEHYNEYEIGTLNGIDRIVKLIERHYR